MSAGVLNQLSIKKETVWGTPVVPDKSVPVHFSGGIQTDQDVQVREAAKATLAKNYHALVGARKHEGDLAFDLFSDYPAYFILSAMGGLSSALKGGESIVYEHTFSEAETKPSLTIEQVIGENVRRYAGSITQSLRFSLTAGEVAELEAHILSKSQASATKITPAYTTVRPFNYADAVVKIGGTTLGEVRSIEIEYNNNIDMLHTLNNTNDPSFTFAKGSEVSGKIELYLDSATLAELNNYLTKTERSVQLTLTGDAVGVAANHKMDILIPRAVFTTAETPLADDYNSLTIEFQGIYDTVTSKLLSIVVTNTLANYN